MTIETLAEANSLKKQLDLYDKIISIFRDGNGNNIIQQSNSMFKLKCFLELVDKYESITGSEVAKRSLLPAIDVIIDFILQEMDKSTKRLDEL